MNDLQIKDLEHRIVLPSEIMLSIFSYLRFRDLTRCLFVDKWWNHVASDLEGRIPNAQLARAVYEIGLKTSFESLTTFQKAILEKSQTLDLSSKKGLRLGLGQSPTALDSTRLEKLDAFPNLKTLDLRNNQLRGDALKYVHKVPISSLNLRRCRFSNLTLLEGHSTLENLNLFNSNITNEMLESLRSIPHLKTIVFSNTNITDYRYLSGLAIETLNLSNCTMSSATFELLSTLPKLTTLLLGACYTFSNEDLLRLTSTSLKTLHLNQCFQVTDQTLKNLNGLALEQIDVSNCTDIGDLGIQNLEGHPLTTLKISYCVNITDEGLRYAQNFVSLTKLDLTGCKGVSENGFTHLTGLPIRTLKLRFCSHLTDNALINCRGLPLRKLDLLGCKNMTDLGLRELVEQHSIEELNIRQCNRMTDEEIAYLTTHSLTPIRIKRASKSLFAPAPDFKL